MGGRLAETKGKIHRPRGGGMGAAASVLIAALVIHVDAQRVRERCLQRRVPRAASAVHTGE